MSLLFQQHLLHQHVNKQVERCGEKYYGAEDVMLVSNAQEVACW